ncbi:uncharacterized protein B0I36DRAFT_329114 [Microdochium trichocladiopsis]|uniref:Secreted protein n=1 Tax=Microdochium trichocladiopsis TaxID=1682393 RepID=A0A9P8Y253_9PEZI|nr:uncharacterized protein B0I36DRAFT_329114 [Microdochium trichocladiopsis]KAH7025778.1 hypothetical protein B0I36DRAFT_329114 [Microdochium trichocladiopsis]
MLTSKIAALVVVVVDLVVNRRHKPSPPACTGTLLLPLCHQRRRRRSIIRLQRLDIDARKREAVQPEKVLPPHLGIVPREGRRVQDAARCQPLRGLREQLCAELLHLGRLAVVAHARVRRDQEVERPRVVVVLEQARHHYVPVRGRRGAIAAAEPPAASGRQLAIGKEDLRRRRPATVTVGRRGGGDMIIIVCAVRAGVRVRLREAAVAVVIIALPGRSGVLFRVNRPRPVQQHPGPGPGPGSVPVAAAELLFACIALAVAGGAAARVSIIVVDLASLFGTTTAPSLAPALTFILGPVVGL